jgi:hypothetical protein
MRVSFHEGLTWGVKMLLDVIWVGGLLIYVTLPAGLRWYLELMFSRPQVVYRTYLIFLYASGIFALLIVWEMRRIFARLRQRQPFVRANVDSLIRVGLASLAIGLLYFIKLFFLNTILTIVAVMIFLIAGLFALVLAGVFQQAIEVKEELDLTI